MRDTLRKAKPQCLEDLIALNALYRPGPLRGGVVDDYIARKHGRVEIKYELPQMEPVAQGDLRRHRLSGTGHAARERAGRLHARAGRRAAPRDGQEGRREDAGAARTLHERLPASAASPEKKATKIFEFIEFFAGYGFNKSHSTTYALLAYQTAYLKANYPRHFMAALLTIESQNSDKVALYLAECRELGVPVLPPDINASQLAVHRAARRRAVRTGRRQGRRRRRDPVDPRDARRRSAARSRRCSRWPSTSTCAW